MAVIRLQGEYEKARGVYYEVDPTLRPIGIGGMGRVYEGICVNERTGDTMPVAVKFMFDDLPAHAIERARREASIHLQHENLIEMLGFIETHDNATPHYHVVSELLHGVSLSDVLKGKNVDFSGHQVDFVMECQEKLAKEPEEFAKEIVSNVLAGLSVLHDEGYIHRDIDPSNIMLTTDGHIKIIDFGIAKKIDSVRTDSEHTQIGSIVGKPKYAAPEICLGDIANQNVTTDIYAVGILLYQLICGHVPFSGTVNDIIQAQIKKNVPVSNIRDKALRAIVKQATEKQQQDRFQSAAEFRLALNDVSDSKQLSNTVIAILALVGLALGIALAFII